MARVRFCVRPIEPETPWTDKEETRLGGPHVYDTVSRWAGEPVEGRKGTMLIAEGLEGWVCRRMWSGEERGV